MVDEFVRKSRRRTQRDPVVAEYWRTWGARLRLELRSMGKDWRWLGEQVYPNRPSSIRQVLNGHQGMSREAFNKVLELVPAMRTHWEPPIFVEAQGVGAPGPHKPHDYPNLGRRVGGWNERLRDANRRLFATVDADDGMVRVSVLEPLTPDEARRLGESLIVAAYHCDHGRDGAIAVQPVEPRGQRNGADPSRRPPRGASAPVAQPEVDPLS